MPYKFNTNQENLEKGFARYDFYFKYNGKRYRSSLKCRRSTVDACYRDWQDKILKGSESGRRHLLFEIMDEYLLENKQVKSLNYCQTEERSLKRLKHLSGLIFQ